VLKSQGLLDQFGAGLQEGFGMHGADCPTNVSCGSWTARASVVCIVTTKID